MDRNELAEKLEIIGNLFEIDGMDALVNKYEKGISLVKFNAITIQIEALLLKANKKIADELIAKNMGVSIEEVEKFDDAEYSTSLRNAIITDVMGFFASSQRMDGQK